MTDVKKVVEAVNEIAPFDTQYEWDNCGANIALAGETERVLVALDITQQSVAAAAELGCGIIVCHHPLFFNKVSCLSEDDPAVLAIKHGVSIVAAHTCWDRADGGVNDVIAGMLNLTEVRTFSNLGRTGRLPSVMKPLEFADFVKRAFGCEYVQVVDGGRDIATVAVIGGAAKMVRAVLDSGADAYVTGELKHSEALLARDAGLTVVAAGHFETEAPSGAALAERLRELIDAEVILYDESKPIEYV